MIFEPPAVVFAGLAGGGVASPARRFARALPLWIAPAAAGGAMLATAVSLECAWCGRTVAALPDRVAVAAADESRAPRRPWTHPLPHVDRFVAVDRGSVSTHAEAPDRRIADVVLFARWHPPRRVRAAFDCARGRRADLLDGVTHGEDGAVAGAAWLDTGLDDSVTRLACGAARAWVRACGWGSSSRRWASAPPPRWRACG